MKKMASVLLSCWSLFGISSVSIAQNVGSAGSDLIVVRPTVKLIVSSPGDICKRAGNCSTEPFLLTPQGDSQ